MVGLEFGGHFFFGWEFGAKGAAYTRLINKIKFFYSTLVSMDSIADLYKRTSFFFVLIGRFSRSTVCYCVLFLN